MTVDLAAAGTHTRRMTKRRILAIDGGGDSRAHPGGAAGRRWSARRAARRRSSFDFLAGTSTGADPRRRGRGRDSPGSGSPSLYRRRGPELFRRIADPERCSGGSSSGHQYDVATPAADDRRGARRARGLAGQRRPAGHHAHGEGPRRRAPWYFVKDRPGQPGQDRTGGLLARRTASPPPRRRRRTSRRGAVDGHRAARGRRRRRRRQPDLPGVRRGVRVHDRLPPAETIVVSLGHGAVPRSRAADVALVVGRVGARRDVPLARASSRPSSSSATTARRASTGSTSRLPRDFPLDAHRRRHRRAAGDRRRAWPRRIDWPAILDGDDTEFLVGPGETRPEAYCRVVA